MISRSAFSAAPVHRFVRHDFGCSDVIPGGLDNGKLTLSKDATKSEQAGLEQMIHYQLSTDVTRWRINQRI
jgi:hypothetical protein